MMNHIEADLLQAPANYCIAHCCSADLKLGAGVARTIQARYSVRSAMQRQNHSVGRAVSTARHGRIVYNLVTKNKFFEKPTYAALEYCLRDLKSKMVRNNQYFLAIPELGCGRDDLSLSTVNKIIEDVFAKTNIRIVMCHWKPTWERRSPQGHHLCQGRYRKNKKPWFHC